MELHGNDRGTFVDFRGCCHGLPWKSAHAKGHGSWRFHGKCHGCVHGTCRGSVRGKLRGTNHGNLRKSTAIATSISADVKPQKLPRPSAAIVTAILPHVATATEVCSNFHANFRGRQTTAISTAIRGNLPIQGICHRSPWQMTQQFPRHSAAICGN